MYKNSSHQLILPSDVSGETTKADLCRTYCMVAAACPLYTPSASRAQGVLPTKELFKVMLTNVRYHTIMCLVSWLLLFNTFPGQRFHHRQRVLALIRSFDVL